MAYQILRHRQRWDGFWEQQNRQRFLAPKGWAGSATSKLLSFLFAAVLLIGGLLGFFSYLFNLVAFAP